METGPDLRYELSVVAVKVDLTLMIGNHCAGSLETHFAEAHDFIDELLAGFGCAPFKNFHLMLGAGE